mgnify:CR=1 FL=1
MIQDIYNLFNATAQKTIEHTREELRTIRTGKPTPSILENLSVKAYGGTDMRLQELATIASDSNSSLIVQPFDPSILKDIETAILAANLNLTPRIESGIIRVIFPPLDEAQRIQFVKFASQLTEEGKIKIRNIREDMRKDVKQMFDGKEITEDERFKAFEEVDKMTKEFGDNLDELKKKKEEEIMTI